MWNKLLAVCVVAGLAAGGGIQAGEPEFNLDLLSCASQPVAFVDAQQVVLDVTPVRAVLKANEKQTTWVRVGLTGFELADAKERAPVNVAIVLDRSGSMSGEKLERAREAATNAIDRLRSDDIVSIITYDDTVQVLVPATKLTDKEAVRRQIMSIQAGGSTALFAGVSKGAAEIRKFLDQERVNRIILLSDGLANVGPSTPGELGSLGKTLKKDGISVSTLGLGLGYNEDLMLQLASASGGNHMFIERATELADIFNREFDDVTSVVAQEIRVDIKIPEGIRPVRVLGHEAEIVGQSVTVNLSQVYSRQNKHVVLEVEYPATESGTKLTLANVAVQYHNMHSGQTDRLTSRAEVSFSSDAAKVEDSLDKVAMEDVVALVANEQNKLATLYLDQGDIARSNAILDSNGRYLKDNADKLGSERLKYYYMGNSMQQSHLLQGNSNQARKQMRDLQNEADMQRGLSRPATP